jgi:hypothetical protein
MTAWRSLNPVRFVGDALSRRSGRALWLRICLAPFVVAGVLLWPVFVAAQLPWLLLRALGRWLQRFRVVRAVMPLFTWELWRGQPSETPHPYDLLTRERLLRRVAVPLLALEWTGLLVLGFGAGLDCLTGRHLPIVYISALLTTVFLGIPAAAFCSWHKRLVTRWKDLRAPLCPRCGYNRSHATGPFCSECGSVEKPVPAGQTPPAWAPWSPLISDGTAYMPCALLGSLAPLLMFASRHVSIRFVGGVLLILSFSILAICLAAVIGVIKRRSSARGSAGFYVRQMRS